MKKHYPRKCDKLIVIILIFCNFSNEIKHSVPKFELSEDLHLIRTRVTAGIIFRDSVRVTLSNHLTFN